MSLQTLRAGREWLAAADQAQRLTPRHREVLAALASGETRDATARRLGISRSTVCTYTKVIFRHLDVHTAAQAVARGYELGLLGDVGRRVTGGGS